ncbi:BQ2448_4954 [Microbotryum intermedium]|uniref:BQ2448_4954 protein n=1 Tax=Microbotryum intermedium TaxID=269621 RepID=A0A238FEK4_9BASI|nr:BQ2448_4954 [Microbotryum intermedium]
MSALQYVHEPAVQLRRTISVLSATLIAEPLPPTTTTSACGGPRPEKTAQDRGALRPLRPEASIRDLLRPQVAVCSYCKARHWECERSKKTQHFSRPRCSRFHPPPPTPEYRQLLEGSDRAAICLPAEATSFREHARSCNNALPFSSLSAYFDQTRLQRPGPPLFRVFGRLYHRLGALIPPDRGRENGVDGGLPGLRVLNSSRTTYLHERDDYFSIPPHTERLLLEFVIDGFFQVETDRLSHIRLHKTRCG